MPYPRRFNKRRYAPLYKSIRTPTPLAGVGPNDGIFTRLHTRATIRYTADALGSQRQMLPIPVNYLYYDGAGDGFDQIGNMIYTVAPSAGAFTFVDFPMYTGWADALAPFVTYRISGVAIKMRFYVPYNDVTPVIFKVGVLAERDFGVSSVAHAGGTVSGVTGAANWYSAQSGLLIDTANWNMLNQKVWRQTTSQPGTQTYNTVSAYIDAAKLLHWDRSYYKAQSAITGGITANSTTGNLATVTQPATKVAAQLAFEVKAATDGSPVTDLPNFMFDLDLTYFIRAVDPHTLQNIAVNQVT